MAKTPIAGEGTPEERITKAVASGLSDENARLFEDQGVLRQWLINKRSELKGKSWAEDFAASNSEAIEAALELQRRLTAYNTANNKQLKLNLKAGDAKKAVITGRAPVSEATKKRRAETLAKNKQK